MSWSDLSRRGHISRAHHGEVPSLTRPIIHFGHEWILAVDVKRRVVHRVDKRLLRTDRAAPTACAGVGYGSGRGVRLLRADLRNLRHQLRIALLERLHFGL